MYIFSSLAPQSKNQLRPRAFRKPWHVMFLPSVNRDIWPASRGHSAVREEVWPPPCTPAGWAVCGLYQREGSGWGRSLSNARTGQPGQGAAGGLRLWGQAPVWQVGERMKWENSLCQRLLWSSLIWILLNHLSFWLAVTQTSTQWHPCWSCTCESCLNQLSPSPNMKTF